MWKRIAIYGKIKIKTSKIVVHLIENLFLNNRLNYKNFYLHIT